MWVMLARPPPKRLLCCILLHVCTPNTNADSHYQYTLLPHQHPLNPLAAQPPPTHASHTHALVAVAPPGALTGTLLQAAPYLQPAWRTYATCTHTQSSLRRTAGGPFTNTHGNMLTRLLQ